MAEDKLDAAWREMDEFLKSAKKPATEEDLAAANARYMKILRRCIDRSDDQYRVLFGSEPKAPR